MTDPGAPRPPVDDGIAPGFERPGPLVVRADSNRRRATLADYLDLMDGDTHVAPRAPEGL